MSLLIKVTPVSGGRRGRRHYACRREDRRPDLRNPCRRFLVAVALYVPIVFALVSLQRWIERRQAAAEVAV